MPRPMLWGNRIGEDDSEKIAVVKGDGTAKLAKARRKEGEKPIGFLKPASLSPARSAAGS